MNTITQVLELLLITIGAGVCLVIASLFVGLALMVIRTAWRSAGDDSGESSAEAAEKKPHTKLRRDR